MEASLQDAAAKASDQLVSRLLMGMANAHAGAADALEAGERELEARLAPPKPPPTK